ncbi:DUF2750 domain-containing protein [Aestuariibacter sp. A3R04]|uniref:DUF2750 domain-containing protein n=1 Tax=Aestuariibacter sp. A3R04 TaxID=2841571 RepID=UPI001C089CEB|nr:DUF2750 domain-containing protein [Aestuariibacter sp. A3R04]MBU3022669.1 DUF2750 domain-containing protein [Aestuariibacter sp. A3R04]
MFPQTLSAKLSDVVISQAISLSAEERQELFLQYVVKSNEVWLAQGGDGFVMIEQGDQLCLPVWPHTDLVSTWQGLPGDCHARAVPTQTFSEVWLPGLAKNNTAIVIFPLREDDAGIKITATELLESLQEEGQ